MREKFDFTFPVVAEMEEYVAAIVHEMATIFRISTSEAVDILNRHWEGFAIDADNLLGHEEPDYWARTIYPQHRHDSDRDS